jgi:hypothetical protein
MTPKTDLHQLIHSLTGSEKRYFTLFSRRHVIGNENKYLAIFKGIEKQLVYDEEKLKHYLGKKHFSSNLASDKAYLKNIILRSLKQFHEKNYIDSIVYDRLVQIEILYEKGLFQIGYELIRECLVIADKHEKYLMYASLMNWKMNYDIQLHQLEDVSRDSLKAKMKITLFQESLDSRSLFYDLFLKTSKANKDTKAPELKKIIRSLGKDMNTAKPTSSMGAYYFYSIRSYLAVIQHKTKEMIRYLEQGVKIFKNNLIFCQEEPNLYLKVTNNFIFALILDNDLERAGVEIESMRIITHGLKLGDQQKARAYIYIEDNKLLMLLRQHKFDDAGRLAQTMEKTLPALEKFIEPVRQLDTCFSLASAFFFLKDYKKTNKFLNTIVKSRTGKEMEASVIGIAMVFQLITMLTSGDTILFRNKWIGTQKYLMTFSGVEWMLDFLDFLKLLENRHLKRHSLQLKKELKHKLIFTTQSDNIVKSYMHYFDFAKWLEKQK